MTSNPPLPYAAWDCILPYMSVDTRLALSLRCPAIRNLDQRVPLKIGNLRVSEFFIEVNTPKDIQTFYGYRERDNYSGHISSRPNLPEYRFEVIQVGPGDARFNIRIGHNEDGDFNDIDRYGLSEEGNQRVTDARIAQLEREIRQQETRVRDQRPFATNEWGKRFLRAFEKRIVDLRAEIKEVRKNGYIPPYTYYLQLISNTRFGRKVERLEYKKSIASATEYLFQKLFPKQSLVLVDTLEVHGQRVSLARAPRRLIVSGLDVNFPLNGLEDELCFNYVCPASPSVTKILDTDFEREKVITIRLVEFNRESLIGDIKASTGVQLSETSRHVTVSSKKQFKVTFNLEGGGWTLRVKVERK